LDNVDGVAVHIRRSHNSVSSQIEKPGEYQCNRKSEHDQQYDKAHHPVRDIEHGENLRDSLRQCPARHNIRDGDTVDFPALKLGKEFF
jgi:hypothetical protein